MNSVSIAFNLLLETVTSMFSRDGLRAILFSLKQYIFCPQNGGTSLKGAIEHGEHTTIRATWPLTRYY
jgi:hypothetical protein